MKKFKILADTAYFKIENTSKEVTIFDFTLSNFPNYREEYLEKKFIELFGKTKIYSLSKYPFFLFKGQAENITHINEYVIKSHGDLQLFFNSLWFIKDNSAFLIESLVQIENDCSKSFRKGLNVIFSNSKGEYEDTTFTIKELEDVMAIHNKINSLATSESFGLQEITQTSKIIPSILNGLIFKTQNRIERALVFLQLARSESYLPLKIMFYMSILESLFTMDNNNILDNISNRTSKYLGGNAKKRSKTIYYIKQAYDIRSRLIHGDSLHSELRQTQQDLIITSAKIDMIIRELMLKVILEDSEKFLVSNALFIEWLKPFDK